MGQNRDHYFNHRSQRLDVVPPSDGFSGQYFQGPRQCKGKGGWKSHKSAERGAPAAASFASLPSRSPESSSSHVGEPACLEEVAGQGSKGMTTILCLDLC